MPRGVRITKTDWYKAPFPLQWCSLLQVELLFNKWRLTISSSFFGETARPWEGTWCWAARMKTSFCLNVHMLICVVFIVIVCQNKWQEGTVWNYAHLIQLKLWSAVSNWLLLSLHWWKGFLPFLLTIFHPLHFFKSQCFTAGTAGTGILLGTRINSPYCLFFFFFKTCKYKHLNWTDIRVTGSCNSKHKTPLNSLSAQNY